MVDTLSSCFTLVVPVSQCFYIALHPSKSDIHEVIWILWAKQITPAEIHFEISDVYSECYEWQLVCCTSWQILQPPQWRTKRLVVCCEWWELVAKVDEVVRKSRCFAISELLECTELKESVNGWRLQRFMQMIFLSLWSSMTNVHSLSEKRWNGVLFSSM